MFSLENRRQANFLYSTDGFISGKHDNRTQNKTDYWIQIENRAVCFLMVQKKEQKKRCHIL